MSTTKAMRVVYLTSPYKIVVPIEMLHNFTNSTPEDPHGYKEEVKVKCNATTAVVGKFPNGIGLLEILLVKETSLLLT